MLTKPLALLLLSLFYLFSGSSALFEEDPFVRVFSNITEMSQTASTLDFLAAIFFYANNANNSRSQVVSQRFSQFAEENSDYVKAFAFNCDKILNDKIDLERVAICGPKNQEKLPNILFLRPPRHRLNPKDGLIQLPEEIYFKGEATVENLTATMKEHLPAFIDKAVTKKSLDKLLADSKIPHKALVFHSKDVLPANFRALTSHFRDRIQFIEVQRDGKEVRELYGVTKVPTLMVLRYNKTGNAYDPVLYDGPNNFEKMFKFLKPYALSSRAYLDKDMSVKEYDTNYYDIDADDFLEKINTYEKPIFVHVYKDEKHPLSEEIRKKFDALFGYFNLECDGQTNFDFANKELKIKHFPALVVFGVGRKTLEQRTVFGKGYQLAEIQEELIEFTQGNLLPVRGEKYQEFLREGLITKDPAFVFFYKDEVDLLPLSIISQIPRYREYVKIAKYKEPEEAMIKAIGVTHLPYLIVSFLGDPYLKKHQIKDLRVAHFIGNLYSKDLFIFVDQAVLNNRREEDLKKRKPRQPRFDEL